MSNSTTENRKAIVVGGGLVGCLAAVYLSKNHGHLFPDGVEIYERRKDSRTEAITEGRSINLAISDRALMALDKVGLKEKVKEHGIPMHGRYIHLANGTTTYQPYGRPGQHILSVGRRWLNEALMDEAEKIPNVKFFFQQKAQIIATKEQHNNAVERELLQHSKVAVKFVNSETSENPIIANGSFLLGCDGLNSQVRNNYFYRNNAKLRFSFAHTYFEYGYKELNIPPTKDGQFAIRSDCLHIWPRGKFMIIALPNPTKDFTVTFFAPYDGPNGFSNLDSDEKVVSFFKSNFSDAYELMKDNLLKDWHDNPTSALSHVDCSTFHYDDKIALLGDSAHAIIPFYGQGVNSGFEDVRIFSECLDQHLSLKNFNDETYSQHMKNSLNQFTQIRKPAADAIMYFSKMNFVEMSSSTASWSFLFSKKVGMIMHSLFPNAKFFLPLYSMVTFSPNMSYAEAKDRYLKREELYGKVGKTLLWSIIGAASLATYQFAVKPLLNKDAAK